MKWKRTAMSLALAGCMMATTVPVTAFAANQTTTVAVNTKDKWDADLTADDITFNADSVWVSKNTKDTSYTLTVQADPDEFPNRGTVNYWLEDEKDLINEKKIEVGKPADVNKAGVVTFKLPYNDLENVDPDGASAKLTVEFEKEDKTTVKKTFTLNVAEIEATSVSYKKDLTVWADGNTRTVKLSWSPENVTEIPKVKWAVANTDLATVDEKTGVVTGKAAGTTKLTGEWYNETTKKNETIEVDLTVKESGADITITDQENNSASSVYSGQSFPLKVNFIKMDPNTKVEWKSSDETVATVASTSNNTATVTTKKSGKATITAYAGGETATYEVTVKSNGKACTDLALDKTSLTLRQGQALESGTADGMLADSAARVKIQMTPADADATLTIGTVVAKKNGTNAVTEGIYIAPLNKDNSEFYVGVGANVPVGTYTVTVPVTATNNFDMAGLNGAYQEELSFTLNVTEANSAIAAELELTSNDESDKIGTTFYANQTKLLDGEAIDVDVTPESLRDQITYSIDDTSVAEIVDTDDGYMIVAKKEGGCVLTAKVGGKTAEIHLDVTKDTSELKGIELTETLVALTSKQKKDIDVKALMNGNNVTTALDASRYTALWSSSDEKVATVDGNGVVTGVSTGTATITVQVGAYTASCKVVVNDAGSDPKPAIKFVDVPEKAWYHDAVYEAANKGLMKGTGNDKFEPMGTVERSQVAQIVWNIAGAPAVTGAPAFTDVAANAWYAQPIKWASDQKIVNGIGGNKFGPSLAVTREDFVTMLYRYAKTPAATGDLSKFSDANKVAPHAQDAMKWAVSTGLVNGDDKGQLNPKSTLSRAEAAAIVVRYAK